MKRYVIGLSLVALSMALPAAANTRTYFGFQIGIGGAPPPPAVVFEAPPPVYYEPETRVYVVQDGDDDCDVFRYGRYWYACQGDYWYRAGSYRGPFLAVDVRSVPRPIFYVPERRWRHYPGSLVRWNGEHGRGRGHAYGKWKHRDRDDD